MIAALITFLLVATIALVALEVAVGGAILGTLALALLVVALIAEA
jgi:hypothetical protein